MRQSSYSLSKSNIYKDPKISKELLKVVEYYFVMIKVHIRTCPKYTFEFLRKSLNVIFEALQIFTQELILTLKGT